jgi:DNA-binding NarL/FixJ family response regulator
MSTTLTQLSQSETISSGRVLVGFASRLDAQALEWIIRSERGITAVRLCNDIEELLTYIRAESPRLIIVDEEIADAHLPAVARQFPVRMEQSMIAVFADRFTLRQMEMATTFAHGILSRDDSIQEFTDLLQRLLRKKKCVSTHLRGQIDLNSRNQFETKIVERVTKLTPRQMEVLVQIAKGKSAKEVAQVLHITEKAVESHKYRLMRALNMRDRVELCRWAIREGLISP